MRYAWGDKVRKNARLYLPYCGYKQGFCLSKVACHLAEINGKGCKYYRHKHPILQVVPQMLV